jgi:hypothetical protein
MRRILLYAVPAFVMLLYAGCTKNDKGQPSKDALISLAKSSLTAQRQATYNNPLFIDSLLQGANWAQLSRHAINNYEYLVYVPVKYNDNTTGLVFVLDGRSNIERSYFLQLTGTSTTADPARVITSFYSYQMQGLTVDLSAYTFNRSLQWEMAYAAGINLYRRAVRTGTPPAASATGSHVSITGQNKKQVTSSGCLDYYLVTYYDDGSEDWQYIGTGCTADCTLSRPMPVTSEGAKVAPDAVTVTCGGSGGGGGGGGTSSEEAQDITENLTNKCFQAVLAKLMGGGMTSDLLNLFQTTFNSSDQVNLNYSEAQIAGGSATNTASTTATKTSTGVNVFTTLSDGKLDGAAQEYIAETMLHEAIHGFFDAIGGFSELSQHQSMLIGWVDCEQNALKELFPNLTDANALCLIFGGMGDVQANDPALFATTIASYGLSVAQIQTTNMMYSGGLGTPCPTGGNGGPGGGQPQP